MSIIKRFMRQFKTNGSDSMCCPSCSGSKLKFIGTVGSKKGIPREVFLCRDCTEVIHYDPSPARFYGEPEDIKSHLGDPYDSQTRRNKTIPPWLTRNKPPKPVVKVGIKTY